MTRPAPASVPAAVPGAVHAWRSRRIRVGPARLAALLAYLLFALWLAPPAARAAQPVSESFYTGASAGVTGDDSCSGALPIGFAFDYYGTTFTEFQVSTNGLLFPGSSGCNPVYSNLALPAGYGTNGMLAVYWDDLYSRTTFDSIVLYATIGTAPNRKLVVQWTNYSFYSYPELPFGTIQAILSESTNEIRFQYRQLLSDPYSFGSSATVGVEAPGSASAVTYLYNQVLLQEWQSIRFAPSGGSYTMEADAPYDGVFLGACATPPPAAPALTSPDTGATVSTSPTFQWDTSDGATSYTLKVATNASISSPIVSTALAADQTAYTYTGTLTGGTTYYWVVVAENECGSSWSSTRSFTTSSGPPPVADPGLVVALEDEDTVVTLSGSDPEGRAITARVSSLPAHGALYQYAGGRGAAITTAPAVVTDAGLRVVYNSAGTGLGAGHGTFRFKVNNGLVDSDEATVTVDVDPANSAPTDIALSNAAVAENGAVDAVVGSFVVTDADAGDAHTFALVAGEGDGDNALFAIDGATLRAAASFDHEQDAALSIRVRVTDAAGASYEEAFAVAVTDVNEAPLDVALDGAIVAETASAGVPVGLVVGTDPDEGDTLSYTVVGGGPFGMDGAALVVTGALDHEAAAAHEVTIEARDAGGLAITRTFAVSVTDENEPPLGVTIDTAAVAENSALGTVVGRLTAADPDEGDSHAFEILGWAPFRIDGDALVVDEPLDHEALARLSVMIRVVDAGGLTGLATLDIAIDDVNDAPDGVTLSDTHVAENSAIGTVVGTLAVFDQDAGDAHTYELVGAGPFALDGAALVVARWVDHEVAPAHSVTVRAADAAGDDVEQTFTIDIDDVNERPEAVELSAASVPENSDPGTVVATILVRDPDDGDSHTFSLVSAGVPFAIEGDALVTTAPLDFEGIAQYDLLVRAEDAGGLALTELNRVRVEDTNDPPTAIALSRTSVPENRAVDTPVATITVSDTDAGDGHVCSVLGAAPFVARDGRLHTQRVLDHEARDAWTFDIKCADAAGAGVRTTVTIDVEDVDDPPALAVSGERRFDEASSALAVAPGLTLEDPDGPAIETVEVAIVAGYRKGEDVLAVPAGAAIGARWDEETGVLTLRGPASAEDWQGMLRRVYYLNGSATPASEPRTIRFRIPEPRLLPETGHCYEIVQERATWSEASAAAAAMTVYGMPGYLVTIDDPAEQAFIPGAISSPSWIGAYANEGGGDWLWAVGPEAGQPVGQSSCAVATGVCGFVGTPAESAGAGVIDSTGQWRGVPADTTELVSYVVEFGGLPADPPLLLEGRVRVHVVPNAPPTAPDAAFAVAEDAPAGTPLGALDAADADGDPVLHTIVAGNDDGAFLVDPETGALTLAAGGLLDAETTSARTLIVALTDGVETTHVSVVVTIENVNDNAPTLTAPTWHVAEDAPAGTVVGAVSATDADGDALRHAIRAGAGDGTYPDIFAIDPDTGTIRVSRAGVLDHERTSHYRIELSVTDGAHRAVAATDIFVGNVNDNAPQVADAAFEVAERAPAGTIVGRLQATDADGDALTFAAAGGTGAGIFAVEPDTGVVHLVRADAVDREQVDHFTLAVRASDGVHDGMAVATIAVADANDNVPVVSDALFTIHETDRPGAPLGFVEAVDADGDPLAWRALPGGDADLFRVDEATGAVSVAAGATFDAARRPSLRFAVEVTDGLHAVRARVAVAVEPVNDHAPTVGALGFSVPHDAPVGYRIGRVRADDLDGGPLSFAIRSGDEAGLLHLDPTTGTLSVRDAERLRSAPFDAFDLTIAIDDGRNVTLAPVQVTRTPEGEHAPRVRPTVADCSEITAYGVVVATVDAVDEDGEPLSLAIVGGDPAGAFGVDEGTGEIFVATPAALDFETRPVHVLAIQAFDGWNYATGEVTIRLANENDLAPELAAQRFAIAEGVAADDVIGRVAAWDPDGDALTYGIEAAAEAVGLAIDETTGDLRVVDPARLLGKAAPRGTILVSVSDGRHAVEAPVGFVLRPAGVQPLTVPRQVFPVDENPPAGTPLGAIAWDGETVGEPRFALLPGPGAAAFHLDGATGELRVVSGATLDFEVAAEWRLGVQITDRVSASHGEIVVLLGNRNDNPPQVDDHVLSVSETAAAGDLLGAIPAADRDGDTLRFRVTDGDDAGAFAIDRATGEVVVARPELIDYERTRDWTLTVAVDDGAHVEEAAAFVRVLPENDNPPVVEDVAATVREGAEDGLVVGVVAAWDPDGDPLTFALETVGATGAFAVGPTDGVVTLVDGAALDYERVREHRLQVRVSDGRAVSRAAVVVTVENANDNAPVVADATFWVDAFAPRGTPIGRVEATDRDGDPLAFALTVGRVAPFVLSEDGALSVGDGALLDPARAATLVLGVDVDDGVHVSRGTVTVYLRSVGSGPADGEDPVDGPVDGPGVDEDPVGADVLGPLGPDAAAGPGAAASGGGGGCSVGSGGAGSGVVLLLLLLAAAFVQTRRRRGGAPRGR